MTNVEYFSSLLSSRSIFLKLRNTGGMQCEEWSTNIPQEKIKKVLKEHINFLDIDGYRIGLGQNECNEYIITLTDSTNEVIFGFVLDSSLFSYLMGDLSQYNNHPRVIVDRKSLSPTIEEGFMMNEEGDITILLSPKKSFMDKYDENHKLLAENYKNKNYEAVKHHLAIAFMLLTQIDRSKQFRVNKEDDLIKARAFLINDFKTYLKKLQMIEPEFNFATFYITNNYDKHILNIPIKTIQGIKAFIRKILLNF